MPRDAILGEASPLSRKDWLLVLVQLTHMRHETLKRVMMMIESTCLWPCSGGTRLLNAAWAGPLPGGLRRQRPFNNKSIQMPRVAQSSVDFLDSPDILETENFESSFAGECHTGLCGPSIAGCCFGMYISSVADATLMVLQADPDPVLQLLSHLKLHLCTRNGKDGHRITERRSCDLIRTSVTAFPCVRTIRDRQRKSVHLCWSTKLLFLLQMQTTQCQKCWHQWMQWRRLRLCWRPGQHRSLNLRSQHPPVCSPRQCRP